MVEVTEEEFFRRIYADGLNVHPRSEQHCSIWEKDVERDAGRRAMNPPRIPDDLFAGCCQWVDFYPSFVEQYQKWFDLPPTERSWKTAIRDWRRGNTGWEAAHNARRRSTDKTSAKWYRLPTDPPMQGGER